MIREARKEDMIEIMKISQSLPISDGLDYRLEEYFKDKRLDEVFVCEEESKIIAFFWVERGEGEGVYYLDWLSVSIPFQGKGIGRKILDFIEERYKPRVLIVETLEGCPAEKFYKKNGFVEIGTIKDFYKEGMGKKIFVKYFR